MPHRTKKWFTAVQHYMRTFMTWFYCRRYMTNETEPLHIVIDIRESSLQVKPLEKMLQNTFHSSYIDTSPHNTSTDMLVISLLNKCPGCQHLMCCCLLPWQRLAHTLALYILKIEVVCTGNPFTKIDIVYDMSYTKGFSSSKGKLNTNYTN